VQQNTGVCLFTVHRVAHHETHKTYPFLSQPKRYHWFFALFSFFPALVECALAFAVTQMNAMQYK
jgi:hypothetical protein